MCGAKSLLRVAMLKDSKNRDGFDFVVLHIDVENNTLMFLTPPLHQHFHLKRRFRQVKAMKLKANCSVTFCMWKMSGKCNTLECSPTQDSSHYHDDMKHVLVTGHPQVHPSFSTSQPQRKVRKLAFCSPQKKWHKPKLPSCTPNHFL